MTPLWKLLGVGAVSTATFGFMHATTFASDVYSRQTESEEERMKRERLMRLGRGEDLRLLHGDEAALAAAAPNAAPYKRIARMFDVHPSQLWAAANASMLNLVPFTIMSLGASMWPLIYMQRYAKGRTFGSTVGRVYAVGVALIALDVASTQARTLHYGSKEVYYFDRLNWITSDPHMSQAVFEEPSPVYDDDDVDAYMRRWSRMRNGPVLVEKTHPLSSLADDSPQPLRSFSFIRDGSVYTGQLVAEYVMKPERQVSVAASMLQADVHDFVEEHGSLDEVSSDDVFAFGRKLLRLPRHAMLWRVQRVPEAVHSLERYSRLFNQSVAPVLLCVYCAHTGLLGYFAPLLLWKAGQHLLNFELQGSVQRVKGATQDACTRAIFDDGYACVRYRPYHSDSVARDSNASSGSSGGDEAAA